MNPPISRRWHIPFWIYWIGSLLLPIAWFGAEASDPEYYLQVLGNALPYGTWLNRAVFLGIICSLGCIVLFARQQVPLRWTWGDTFACLWCATPMMVGIANDSPLVRDLEQSGYLACTWGSAYFVGRIAGTYDLLTRRTVAWIVSGGCLFGIFALSEFHFGRFWYELLYGPHPYVLQGEVRWFGFRPLLFWEDPNQAGMGWCTVAILGGWLVAQKPVGRSWFAWPACLFVFLYQGIGGICLTLLGWGLLFVTENLTSGTSTFGRLSAGGRSWGRVPLMGLGVGIVVVLGLGFLFRGPLLHQSKRALEASGLYSPVRETLRAVGLGSFGWRLAIEERALQQQRQQSVTKRLVGAGDVNAWRELQEDERPWGLVSLVSMAYGWIGVCTLTLFLLGPMGLALRAGWLKRGDKGPLKIGVLVSILIIVHGLDALGNCAFYLPIVSLIGALSSRGGVDMSERIGFESLE